MATPTTKPESELTDPEHGINLPAWPMSHSAASSISDQIDPEGVRAPAQDALQALLAFSALHDQLRRRKALSSRHTAFDSKASLPEFEPSEQFVLDDVLQLVAEKAVAITGADGLAIALAENNEIVLRAAAGIVRPDVGARIDRDSAFSGACFQTAQVVNCDDTETDPRVNLQACRKLGARSMIAVPLCGRRRVIGVLEAFSAWPFGFNETDISNLTLMAELVLAALKPEDEDRFAQSAEAAATRLDPASAPQVAALPLVPAKPSEVITSVVSPKALAAAAVATSPVIPPPVIPPVVSALSAPVAAPQASAAVVPLPQPIKATAEPTKEKEIPPASAEETVESAFSAQAVSEPVLTFGQVEPEASPKRLGTIALLIGIVVVLAFAAGFWWKYKASQIEKAMVQTEPASAGQTSPVDKPLTPPATPVNASPAPATDSASEPVDPDASAATPQEASKFPRVTGVRHWSSAESSTVVLDLEDQVQYEAHRLTGPDRIYFDLHDTQLTTDLIGKSIDVGDGLINRIRMAQPVAGMTRVVLETKADTNFSVSLESSPFRLIVEVRKIGTSSKGAVNLFPNAPETEKKASIVVPPPTKEDLQLRARVPKMRIVVDAGHGGWDLGTVGRRGLLEKDLVLEIAQRLGKLLQSRLGSDVIYTRQDDNYIPLDERAEIANQSQADLFISVHANYSDLPSARGVETYFTNRFSAPGSKDAGSKDADEHTVADAVKNTVLPALSPADLHDRVDQSRRLAASVQRSLYGTLSVQNPGLRDRGIKEAGFVVLTESSMPGILAEVSFVSSPTDEQKLRSDGYREQIAEALYKGIARYAASSRGVKMASAGK